MKAIELTRGQWALVDDGDYDELNSYMWYAHWMSQANGFYAYRWVSGGGMIAMHRQILGLRPRSSHVDHVDHDSLNNQRANLRVCTHRQNQGNSRKRAGCSSQFKGVYFTKGKWQAMIRAGSLDHNGHHRKINLGRFAREQDAAEAYNKAAIETFGEFANLNIIRGEAAE